MAAVKVSTVWTAFIAALRALLTSLGLTSAPAAPHPAYEPVTLPGGQTAARTVPAPRRTLEPDRAALPPTMKQRIRAEAHGASPATRHLPRAFDGPGDVAPTPRTDEAALLLTA